MNFFKDLLTGEKLPTNAKFQHNISKITPTLKAFPQKHREMGNQIKLDYSAAYLAS